MSNMPDSVSYYIRRKNHLYGPLLMERVTFCLGRNLFDDSDEISSDQLQWKTIKKFTEESNKLQVAVSQARNTSGPAGQNVTVSAQAAIPVKKERVFSARPVSRPAVSQPVQTPFGQPPMNAGGMMPGGQPGMNFQQPGAGYPPPGAGYPPPGAGYPPPGTAYANPAQTSSGNSVMFGLITILLIVVSIVISATTRPSLEILVVQIIMSIIYLVLSISGVISGKRHNNTGGFVLNLILLILWVIGFFIGLAQSL